MEIIQYFQGFTLSKKEYLVAAATIRGNTVCALALFFNMKLLFEASGKRSKSIFFNMAKIPALHL